jgi:hypothetical protein
MKLRDARSLVLLIALLCIAGQAPARWSNDPAVNLAIADRPGEQVVPKVAATSDGGCYVSWFDNAVGGYRVYLQRLNRWGDEMWPHNGILVSSNPQSTSLVDWDLDADASDHAIVVFTDTRAGSDLDVYAYRIAPDGTFEWGPNGRTLSSNADFEPSPRSAPLPDGNIIVAWPRIPDTGTGSIMIQKISPDGTLLFNPPVEIVGGTNENPSFCDVCAAGESEFIVEWLRDTRTFTSPRHVRAQKFSADGLPLWGALPVSVFDLYSVPIGYYPILLPDGAGGAIAGWHYSNGNYFFSAVQHLGFEGAELFAHNGVTVSTQANYHQLDPTVAYQPLADEIFVFWSRQTYNQDRWGINAQKIASDGSRMWTSFGVSIRPVDTIYKGLPQCVPVGDGAVVLFFEEPSGSVVLDRIDASRLDSAGSFVWGASPILVSSILSDKARLPTVVRPDGVTIGIWEDNRAGNVDVYGQSLNPDGTLGVPAASAGDPSLPTESRPGWNQPNPFASSTRIVLGDPAMAGSEICVFDAAGRLVRRLGPIIARSGEVSIAWDGRDDRGALLPDGTYFYRTDRSVEGVLTGKAILLRR